MKRCIGILLPAVVAVLVTACGSSTSSTSDAGHHKQHKHRKTGFAGLGASKHLFVTKNYQGPSNPAGVPHGLAWYSVDAVDDKGRVTAFHVTENAKPPMGDQARMQLVSGLMIAPRSAPIPNAVNQSPTCIVWRVPGLRQRLGVDYAVATTTTGSVHAAVRASRSPTCP